MPLRKIMFAVLMVALAAGCQDQPPAQETAQQTEAPPAAVAESVPAEQPDPGPPPSPPLFEDFQGEPQLSLFPRAGDFRPADDSENLAYWATFIDHLSRVSGLVEKSETGDRAWRFRSINTIDSVAWFSPVAVEPATGYQISFTLQADLPEGASAGIGILEFDRFLWIGEQFTEEMFEQHFRGSREGARLTGKIEGEQSFRFTSGPETGMIHLILFREGTHDRDGVIFDDIRIEAVAEEAGTENR
ncbi:MAG: hypothetical protein RQ723_10080 [Desulfuromonadales bacterium]|nr:hypothetical protein [Desulfuromonadales bacterium]